MIVIVLSLRRVLCNAYEKAIFQIVYFMAFIGCLKEINKLDQSPEPSKVHFESVGLIQ